MAEVPPGQAWSACVNGQRCGFGSLVEVFELREVEGTLDRVGSYDAQSLRLPDARVVGRHVLVPTTTGFEVHRAEALP